MGGFRAPPVSEVSAEGVRRKPHPMPAAGDDLYGPPGKGAVQGDLHQPFILYQGQSGLFRHEADAQIAQKERQHQVGSGHLHVQLHIQSLSREEVPIGIIGGGPPAQPDPGAVLEPTQRGSCPGQAPILWTACQYLCKIKYFLTANRMRHGIGRGDHGEIQLSVGEALYDFRGGVVVDLDPDGGMPAPEILERVQQEQVQRRLRGADLHRAASEGIPAAEFGLGAPQV